MKIQVYHRNDRSNASYLFKSKFFLKSGFFLRKEKTEIKSIVPNKKT